MGDSRKLGERGESGVLGSSQDDGPDRSFDRLQVERTAARRFSGARASTGRTANAHAPRVRTSAKRSPTKRTTRNRPAGRSSNAPSALAIRSVPRPFLIAAGIALAAVAVVLVVALVSGVGGRQQAEDNASDADAQADASAAQPGKATGPYSISFASTGDLIFWREVADYIKQNGGASAMANIAEHLASADVTIANVESPLSDDESEPITDKDVYIIGRPEAIESIKNSDITLASLANNHIMDYGKPALEDTLQALDGAGVLHAGAGLTEEAASASAELTVNGASIAFFSWTDIVPDYFLADDDEPGVVSARMNMDDALRRIREAKQTHDIVIVAMHWGVEYEDYITDYLQSEPAYQLVEAGADVVLGNHPHVIEGIEFYRGSLIAYAHGNCVFRQKYDHTHESYLLNFDMTQDGISNVVATPLYLDDKYGIPDFATGKQAEETLARLEEISADMNTAFDIRDGKAFLSPLGS